MKKTFKILLGSLYKRWISYITRRKISKIYSRLNRAGVKFWNPAGDIIRDHKSLWKKYKHKISLKWLMVYGTISGIFDFRYIPEDIYYGEIEPRLNSKIFSKAYTDKNAYHSFLNNEILPGVILRSINGTCYYQDYSVFGKVPEDVSSIKNMPRGKYVIKPTIDTGGGTGVRVITVSESKIEINPSLPEGLLIEDLFKFYKRDFLIQSYIEQHHFFSQFNPSSLNTVRVLTYRSLRDESVVLLHKILRMGKTGNIVDNQASGGIACGILPNGLLSDFGVDKYGNKHYDSNGIVFANVGEIPYLGVISEIAIKVAPKFVYSRLLGMDFGVDKDGKVFLVEVNDSNNEINFYQMNNGPLFGEYTDEITSLCIHEPKSFVIDFNLD